MPKDIFANIAYGSAIETAAGTMAYGEITSGIAMFEKKAWLISRVEYSFGIGKLALLVAEADYIQAGITVSNKLTGFDLSDPALIDSVSIGELDFGTPANAVLPREPWVNDYSGLQGGGILIAPNPIYVAIFGYSLAAVAYVEARIYFTYVDLKPEEYWELVESRRLIT